MTGNGTVGHVRKYAEPGLATERRGRPRANAGRPRFLVGVIGGRAPNVSSGALELAEEFGGELGRRGLTVVCGGEDGVMEAVCRGCQTSGGTTIGVMKGNQRAVANRYLDYVILTSMDLARSHIIVWSSNVVIAFEGKYGTLNEIALALDIGKPLVIVGKPRLLNARHLTPTPQVTLVSDRNIDKVALVDLVTRIGEPQR